MGFGGHGLQVRDVLHVDDLYDLLVHQLNGLSDYSGSIFNVGGGMANSASLCELTAMCQKISGNKTELGRVLETRDADVPFYVTDYELTTRMTGWMPKRSLDQILEDVWRWLVDHRPQLESILSQ
jgi:CDP-paratose 2-epimerase